jgi:hypothetical protein
MCPRRRLEFSGLYHGSRRLVSRKQLPLLPKRKSCALRPSRRSGPVRKVQIRMEHRWLARHAGSRACVRAPPDDRRVGRRNAPVACSKGQRRRQRGQGGARSSKEPGFEGLHRGRGRAALPPGDDRGDPFSGRARITRSSSRAITARSLLAPSRLSKRPMRAARALFTSQARRATASASGGTSASPPRPKTRRAFPASSCSRILIPSLLLATRKLWPVGCR